VTPTPAELVARTRSVDETQALAAAVAQLALPGDLLLLAGDLGAGKTAFVQGFGLGQGVDEPITSPTFTLAQRYDGTHVIHHLDVYRLSQLHEVLDLGLSELLDEGGIVLVEWGDAVVPVVPNDYLEVRLTFGAGNDDRELAFRAVGTRWAARHRSLQEALASWTRPRATAAEPRNGTTGGQATC
jgi:tRNA threonylcarbamoyladenosine biosynthesis protein TsaE